MNRANPTDRQPLKGLESREDISLTIRCYLSATSQNEVISNKLIDNYAIRSRGSAEHR